MFPYIVFIILLLFFRFKQKPFLIYLTLLLFSVLRYDTGWDYMSYVSIVENWGINNAVYLRYRGLWAFLFSFAQKIQMPHLAIAVPGAITVSIVYYVVSKIQKTRMDVCDALMVYALWPFFYLGTFSTIRQGLAISIGLLMMLCAMDRKWIWFFVLLVINVSVHPSSIVCLFFAAFFLPEFRLKAWHMIMITGIALIGLLSASLILQNSPLEVYATYLEQSDAFGSKLLILLGIMLVPTLLVRKNQLDKTGITDVYTMSLVLQIVVFLFISSTVVSRITDYYVILLIFVAPYFKQLFKSKKQGATLVYIAFIGIFFYYLVSTQEAANQGLATSPFVPYKFIFGK